MKHLVAVALMLLAGCHHTRKTLVPDVPQNGDAEARSRFQDARAKFLRDGGDGVAFKAIAEDFPHDPIVPWAELYAGMAEVKSRAFADADKQLAKVIVSASAPDCHCDGLAMHARMFLGIAKNYEGDAAGAREMLSGTDAAIEDDDQRTEWLAAIAFANASGGDAKLALHAFDQLWPRVTPAERAVILARIDDVAAAAPADLSRRMFDELDDRNGPSFAIIGSRLAAIADQHGDAAGAAKLREVVAPARAAVGLPRTIAQITGATATSGDAGVVGAVVPLGSTKDNRVAEAAVAGLGLAAGAPDGKGVVAIEMRAATDKTAAAEAVDQLAHHNVIAVVGPIEGASVDAAGGRADGLGVPLISLATNAEQRATHAFVFHIRHSPDARARTLARSALAKGVTRFAVLAPDTAYGKGVTAAFTDAVAKGGGKIVVSVTYPKDTKSFAEYAAKAKAGGDWNAVFVPDDAEKLGLLVPALAASGRIPKPAGTKKTKLLGGDPVLLLSTAEGLSGDYVTNAGRHSEGALLAPGFYPDEADPDEKPFIDRFVAAYGHAPGATEAYAFDAAALAAAGGGGGRASLAAILGGGQLAGVTGAIRFDADHRRADPGVVYTIVEETGGVFAIRALR